MARSKPSIRSRIEGATFLGVDIGTSGVKAEVLDEHGALAGQGTAALSVQRPRPLWSVQDPGAWWDATTAAAQAIDAAVRRAVRGIGLAGQMHGATTCRMPPARCGWRLPAVSGATGCSRAPS
ncbi:hypothetical protein LK533_01115 [Sphingomonas sp. PL-96]|nr:FGGY family carbohydrate kinase [Sphingomonas sp. PL-96]MCC2975271.1 hypothetical protein [Sphingomonas sp. PL-96]